MADTLQVLAVTGAAFVAVFVLKRVYWPRRPRGQAPECGNCPSDASREPSPARPSRMRVR